MSVPPKPRSEIELKLEQNEEWQKAQRGELYRAFVPELILPRDICATNCAEFNRTSPRSRREVTQAWRKITQNPTPLPTVLPDPVADDLQFADEPLVCAPVTCDWGFNVHLGPGSFVNFNAVFIDTCPIVIGARTIVAPNCSFYSGTHPVDPAVRNGLLGPETGKPICVGDDCWIGGNSIILPGVTIGRGCTVGAGSVVTKDVPPFHVVVGNPARILRKIETVMDTDSTANK